MLGSQFSLNLLTYLLTYLLTCLFSPSFARLLSTPAVTCVILDTLVSRLLHSHIYCTALRYYHNLLMSVDRMQDLSTNLSVIYQYQCVAPTGRNTTGSP